MITTPTVSGKPGQAPMGLSCDLYPLIGSHSTWTDPRGPVRLPGVSSLELTGRLGLVRWSWRRLAIAFHQLTRDP
jgi:hypothetical protein